MDDREIKDLLRRADLAAGPPPVPPAGLPERIRTRAARGRRNARLARRAGAGAIMVALVAGAVLLPLAGRPGRPTANQADLPSRTAASPAESEDLRAEIARIDAEVEARMAIVGHMLEIERRRKRLAALKRKLERPGAEQRLDEQIERAAFITINQADRMERQLNMPDEAAERYRQVIRLFPQTSWARVAAEGLRRVEELKEG